MVRAWGLLDPAWGCMLATYMFYRALPSLRLACLMGLVVPSLGLYVGNLQLPTYMSWTQFGAVCWQPRSYGACWTQLGAVCWQPTGLMGLVGPSLGLYVGNLQVLWGLLDPA